MERVPLGAGGLQVSRLALGTMTFGWTADEPASFAILDAYVAAGGNFLDTADIYARWARGNTGGESESLIGRWLEARGEQLYRAPADSPLFTTLWFVDRTLGPAQRHRVRLVLTGDDHHYARYSPTDTSTAGGFAPELVTCGGGGAFLASTHHLPDDLRFDLAHGFGPRGEPGLSFGLQQFF